MNSWHGFLSRSSLLVVFLVEICGAEVFLLYDSNFEQTIQKYERVLVNFYASQGCDECETFASEYVAAANLSGSKPKTLFAEVDCQTVGKATCKAYGVSLYPKLIGFTLGDVAFYYNGPKTTSGIVQFLSSQSAPAVAELKTLAEVEKFLKEPESSVIGFFEDPRSEEAVLFENVSSLLSNQLRFAYCQKEILKHYGYKNNVVIFRSSRLKTEMEESLLPYTGKRLTSDLVSWIKSTFSGLAGLRTKRNMLLFKTPLVVVYFKMDFHREPMVVRFWRERVLRVAKKASGLGLGLTFALSDASDFKDELDEYSLECYEKPVVAARDVHNQKYVIRDDFSIERLENFALGLGRGRLKPYLKSQEIPPVNNGPVKVVVADSFDLIVNDHQEDVFIEFYDPNSITCQEIAPIYEELAKELSDEYSVVVAKMDVVANEVSLIYPLKELPTFYFVRKHEKAKPILYEGRYTLDGFLKFIVNNVSSPLRSFNADGKRQNKKSEL